MNRIVHAKARRRPLSVHALHALAELNRKSALSSQFNPGVTNRLLSGGLVELQNRPSPFASHRPGTHIDYLVITENGRAELRAIADSREAKS